MTNAKCTKQSFIFYSTDTLPKAGVPLLIKFRRKRGTKLILAQGYYEVIKHKDDWSLVSYTDQLWCNWVGEVISGLSYKDGFATPTQINKMYTVLEWAYVN